MNKVKVRIWTAEKAYGQLAWRVGVGHASISMTVGEKKYYITWMAQGSPFAGPVLDVFNDIDSFTKAEDRVGMQGFFGDPELAKLDIPLLADYNIRLPTMQPNSTAVGIDAAKIESFWLDRLDNKPKYSFFSKSNNCTGCVVDALRAGGLDQFVPAPSNWVVQDAHSLLAWVLEAERVLLKANQ